MERLYDLFQKAPDLGSLIDPRADGGGDLFTAGFSELQPLLETALQKERAEDDPDRAALGVAAQGIARAADLLAGQYHLVMTNVPYLQHGKQAPAIWDFSERVFPNAKADLATVFVERCRDLTTHSGTSALVTPQNWLFLGSYKKMREQLLRCCEWDFVARLGPGAFRTISGEVVKAILLILTQAKAAAAHNLHGVDVSDQRSADDKDLLLQTARIQTANQKGQLVNPDARIAMEEAAEGTLLAYYADSAHGITTFDSPRFIFKLWEVTQLDPWWLPNQSTVDKTTSFGGRDSILRWENEKGGLAKLVLDMKANGYTSGVWKAGQQIWGRRGVVVSLMRKLSVCLYTGQPFDANTGVIVPSDPTHLPAIWAFCSSPEFNTAVRRIDQKMNVTNATLVKVPFDLERWQRVADEAGPLPEPYSEDPTQWLFKGQPARSTAPLHAAVARLLGYRWPEQDDDGLDELVDEDGLVPLPSSSGDGAAAERLRALLARAYGAAWSPATQDELLAAVGFGGKTLEAWLRQGFFAQHCALFHQRPFIWHLWDGQRDGFAALVNYHRLDRRLLEKLAYTHLGDWIARQQEALRQGEGGAEARLLAARALQRKLALILEGEPPYDIYARWKTLHEQPLGWAPDLNDGVRLNIRPFMAADVLRARPNVAWKTDRGKNPDGSARVNDLHYTLAEKRAAREQSAVS